MSVGDGFVLRARWWASPIPARCCGLR